MDFEGERLEIWRETAGACDPDDPSTLGDLAVRRRLQGDLTGAESLFRRVLEIRCEALGAEHPEIAVYWEHLAELRFLQGDLAGAEPLFRRALEIRREAMGDSHPEIAATLSSLGLLLKAKGDLAGAEPLFRRALEIRREALGEQHPDSQVSERDLALLRRTREGSAVIAANPENNAHSQPVRTGPETGTPARPHPAELTRVDIPRDYPVLPIASDRSAGLDGTTPEQTSADGDQTISFEEVCLGVLNVLDRVLRLSHRDSPDDPALARCQADATALRDMFAERPPEAVQLVWEAHPLAALVRLVEDRQRLSDHQGANDHEAVKQAYGNSLASAASRARLRAAPSTDRAGPPLI